MFWEKCGVEGEEAVRVIGIKPRTLWVKLRAIGKAPMSYESFLEFMIKQKYGLYALYVFHNSLDGRLLHETYRTNSVSIDLVRAELEKIRKGRKR